MDLTEYIDESIFTEDTQFFSKCIEGRLCKEAWGLPIGTYVNLEQCLDTNDIIIINYMSEIDYNNLLDKESWKYPGHIKGRKRLRIKVEKIVFKNKDDFWINYIHDLFELGFIRFTRRTYGTYMKIARVKVLHQIHGVPEGSHAVISIDKDRLKITYVSDEIAQLYSDWYNDEICIIGKYTKVFKLDTLQKFASD